MKSITFITGNKGKAQEFQSIMGDKFMVERVKIDLPELQGTPNEIAEAKLKTAILELPNQDLIIEDSSLGFEALGDLPGPYIKWFLESMNLEDIPKMLDFTNNKKATAKAIFAVVKNGQAYIVEGAVSGTIVSPRGNYGFGWDKIFVPDGYNMTYAEMDPAEKNRISPRAVALHKVQELYQV